EMPALVARKGGAADAHELVAPRLDQLAEAMRSGGEHVVDREAADLQVEAVQVLPHLARHAIADGARVLTRLGHALDDRVGMVATEAQELEHRARFGLGVAREEFLVRAGEDDDRLPAQTVRLLRPLEHHVVVDVEDARGVLGAFHVARDPEERVGDPGQHQVSPCRTHVSLLPPPWEELTTIDPSRSATRVSPPGTMVTRSPS